MTMDAKHTEWIERAIVATTDGANGPSKLGALLRAVLGYRSMPPCFNTAGAVITSDGFVLCGFTDRHGEYHMGAFVGSLVELIKNFRGLADHLKLTDDQRKALFDEVRKWCHTDYRDRKEWF